MERESMEWLGCIFRKGKLILSVFFIWGHADGRASAPGYASLHFISVLRTASDGRMTSIPCPKGE